MVTEIQVGTETFPTKKALAERIAKILEEAPLEQPLGEYHNLLLALLRRHPAAAEKIGSGVQSFKVSVNYLGTKGFMIIRADGSQVDFSYRKCIHAPTRWEEFVTALRFAVETQVTSFKDTAFAGAEKTECALTGALLGKDEVHVDHASPDTFEALVSRFMTEERLDPDDPPATRAIDNVPGRQLVEEGLAERWRAFHARYAKLRIVGIEAHKRMSRKATFWITKTVRFETKVDSDWKDYIVTLKFKDGKEFPVQCDTRTLLRFSLFRKLVLEKYGIALPHQRKAVWQTMIEAAELEIRTGSLKEV